MNEPIKMDIEAIMRQLPHRYPFLLVDRVLECVPAAHRRPQERHVQRAVFSGHFRTAGDARRDADRGACPGVGHSRLQNGRVVPDDETRFYFVAIDKARFRKPVEPGDQIMLKSSLARAFKESGNPGRRRGRRCRVASAEIMVAPEVKGEAR